MREMGVNKTGEGKRKRGSQIKLKRKIDERKWGF